jgi:hypothetical protein
MIVVWLLISKSSQRIIKINADLPLDLDNDSTLSDAIAELCGKKNFEMIPNDFPAAVDFHFIVYFTKPLRGTVDA